MVGKFQVEGPKILTELDGETRETAKSVIEFWRGFTIGEAAALSLLMAKVTFCILPADICIGEREELWEDEVREDGEEGFVETGEGRSTLVLALVIVYPLLPLEEEWTKEAAFVIISFPDEVAGEDENDVDDDGEDGEDDGDGEDGEDDGDGEDGEDDGDGDTLNPDWGDIGNIWSPIIWLVVFLLP